MIGRHLVLRLTSLEWTRSSILNLFCTRPSAKGPSSSTKVKSAPVYMSLKATSSCKWFYVAEENICSDKFHGRYVVVVKVGKPTEHTKPGNRGKRDSQILVMQYLNRVHFDAPMAPLELEIYHQMRNVIGIDPAFYEYIFTVDADTLSVIPAS